MAAIPETLTGAPSATTGVGAGVPGRRRVELPVAGLTCPKCVQAVERALLAVPGVARATVNLAQGRAFVEYDPGRTTVAALHDAVKAAGYRSEVARARFKIDGITCASCVTRIENALHDTPGVLSATVSAPRGHSARVYLADSGQCRPRARGSVLLRDVHCAGVRPSLQLFRRRTVRRAGNVGRDS
jgi:copper ion binding protein